jgi:hypothetical protein
MPKRPPKLWFRECVQSVAKKKRAKGAPSDPNKLCGWVWYKHTGAEKKRKLLADERKLLAKLRKAGLHDRLFALLKAIDKKRRTKAEILSVGKRAAKFKRDLKASGMGLPARVYTRRKRSRTANKAMPATFWLPKGPAPQPQIDPAKQEENVLKRLQYIRCVKDNEKRYNRKVSEEMCKGRLYSAKSSPESKLGLKRKRPKKTSVKICRKYDLLSRLYKAASDG